MTRANARSRLAVRRLALSSLALAATLGVTLAQDAPTGPATHAEIELAIRRGVDFLVREQEIDGSWQYIQNEYVAGQTALCVYTLLKSGVPREHHAIRRALAFLKCAPDRTTYSRGVLLLALDALGDPAQQPWIASLAEDLIASQGAGFAYADRGADDRPIDLSNSQYGALGLEAAARSGCAIPAKNWLRLAQTVLAWQNEDGGFAYNETSMPSGAMTAAGVSTLILCEHGLEGASTPPQLRASIVKSRELGLEWLARYFRVDVNPAPLNEKGKEERWIYYHLYCLQRVGSLLRTDSIGAHDWYREGATFIVRNQAADGHWATIYGEREPNTCFALLFLRRATLNPTTGSGDALAARGYAPDDPTVDVALRTAGDSPLEIWIGSFGKEARALYAWPGEAAKGLRIARVEYWIDDASVAALDVDPNQPSAERFLVKHTFETAGKHVLRARVDVLAPPVDGAEPERVTLESPQLEVEAATLLEPWMLEYATDRERDLLVGVPCTTTASSTINDHWKPEYAVDLLQTRGWLADEKDPAPTLEIELSRAVRANRIVVSHARETAGSPLTWARAHALEVTVNKRAPQVFRLDPDERKKSVLDLARTEKIQRLELKLLELEPGKDPRHSAGLQEVELQLAPEARPKSSPKDSTKESGGR